MQVEAPAPSKKEKKQAAKVPAKRKKDESSSDDSDDSDETEEETAPPKKVAKTAAPKAAAKAEDSDDSSEEEEAPPKPAKKKAAKPAKAAPKKKEESDDSSEEEEAPKVAKKVKAAKPAKAAKKEESESSEEEEEEPPKKEKTAKPAKAAAKKESSSEDSSSEEEEEKPKKAVKAKKEESGSSSDEEEEEEGSKAKLNGNSKKPEAEEIATVMCRNIPVDATIANLEKFFTKKGIEFTEVRKRDNKMFAHVDLKNPADLDKVLEMNGVEFKGSELSFEKAIPLGTPKPVRTENAEDNITMFVKNIPNAATEDEIRQKLTELFTGVEAVRIPMKGDIHKGFAYVQFTDAASVKDTIENHQGVDYDGRPLYLDYSGGGGGAQKRGGRSSFGGGAGGNRSFGGGGGRGSFGGDAGEKGNVLFVRNLSYDSTEDSLRDVFSDATEVRLPRQPDSGRPKGFAFVEFESINKAEDAFNSFNQTEVDGRLVYISYSNSGGGKGRDGGRGGGGRFGGGGGGRGGGGFGGRGGGGRGGGRGFGGRGGGGRGGPRGRGGFSIGGGSSGKKKTFDSDSD